MLTPTGDDSFIQMILGDWLLCSGWGAGIDTPARSGVRIDASGRFDVLAIDATGALVPLTDVKNSGTWWVSGNVPPTYQLNFVSDDVAGSTGGIFTVTGGPSGSSRMVATEGLPEPMVYVRAN